METGGNGDGNGNSRGVSLSADTNLDSLNDEDFEFLLKELTNHNLPEREKCPLVQHLKAEDARANTSYSSLVQSATSAATITTATGASNTGLTISNSYSSSNNRSTTATRARHRSHVVSKDNEFRSSQAPTHNHHHGHHPHLHQSSSNHCANKQQLANSKLIHQSLEEETELNSDDGGGGGRFGAEANHGAGDCDVDNFSPTNFNLSNVTTTTTSSSASMSSHTLNTMSSATTGGYGGGAATSAAVASRFPGTSNRKSLKPNRANSFTMPSATSDIKNIGFSRTNDSNVVVSNNGAGAAADNINNASSFLNFDPHLGRIENAHLTSKSPGDSALEENSSQSPAQKQSYDDFIAKKYSIVNKRSEPAATLNQSNNIHPFHTSIHIDKMDCLVNSIEGDATSMCSRLLSTDASTEKGLNSHRSFGSVGETSSDTGKPEKMYVEMQNLRQQASIVEYHAPSMKHSRLFDSKDNSVDGPLEMAMLGTATYSRLDQYGSRINKSNADLTSSTSPPNNNSIQHNCNYSSSPANNNVIISNNNGGPNTSNRRDKKKKQKADVKLSQDIEGYIGFMDVADLESIINNTSSINVNPNGKGNGASLANGVDQNGGGRKVSNKNNTNNNQKHDQNATATANEAQAKNSRNDGKKVTGTNEKVNNKKTLNKSQANSLSCDDISVNNNNNGKPIDGTIPNNASPDLSSTTTSGTKSKKNRSKRRQNDKNGKVKNLTNSTSDSKLCELNKSNNNENEKDCQSVCADIQNPVQNQNSSSDDFDDATDAEDEDDEVKLSKKMIRTKQSNHDLLQASQNEINLNDVEHQFYTVSDSEMVDREKDFVTPKSKYLKRKKHLARKPNNTNKDQPRSINGGGGGGNGGGGIKNSMRMPSGIQRHHPGQHHHHSTAPVGVNHLGRGYESERECSITNSIANAPCVSQSLSSSMLAIDNGGKIIDKKSVPPPAANHVDTGAHFDKLVEEFSPALHPLHSANSDNQLNATPSSSDNYKIPSYADIAKSFNVTNTKAAQVATRLSSQAVASENPNSSPVIEEFPQLDPSLPNNSETVSELVSEVTESMQKVNGDGAVGVLKTDRVGKSGAEALIFTNTVESKESVASAMSATSTDDSVCTIIDNNVCNNTPETKSSLLSAEEKDTPPVVICGNVRSNPKPKMENVDSNGGFTDHKIVFGFFDDIQNEFDMIQENYPFYDAAVDAPKNDPEIDTNGDEDCEIHSESCDDINLESFKKNAVHVNDLENHWQEEEATRVSVQRAKQSRNENPKKTLSSSASSPLSSSFDSSPISSTLSSSSVQSTATKQKNVCFISCLKKYRNVSLNDNAELSINNYGNIVDYISCRWVNRKTL